MGGNFQEKLEGKAPHPSLWIERTLRDRKKNKLYVCVSWHEFDIKVVWMILFFYFLAIPNIFNVFESSRINMHSLRKERESSLKYHVRSNVKHNTTNSLTN